MGEGAPARKAHENRLPPPIQLLVSAARFVNFFDRKLIPLRVETQICGKFCKMSVDSAVNCKQNQIADQNKKREILLFPVVYAKKSCECDDYVQIIPLD